MAESNDAEMPTAVPAEPGSQGQGDEQVDDNVQLDSFHTEIDLAWNTVVYKFVNRLSEEEIYEARKQFCGCVNSIIDAYKIKLREVRTLHHMIQVWKKRSKDKSERIKQLERDNTNLSNQNTDIRNQLASKVCEDCGEKRITEQLSSLSMQENKNESPESRSETDGGREGENIELFPRKRPREIEENDLSSDDEGPHDVYKCPHASCGLDALLFMIYKIKIQFCPSKFIQVIGTVTSGKGPNCTQILNNLKDKDGHFLQKIYTHENIDEDEQKEALKNAKEKFRTSEQKVGILSYWTDSYNHCVNIHKSKDGNVKIYDANRGKKYIENLEQVRYLEVAVLSCDKNDGVPHIIKRWSKCHVRHCKTEVKKVSKPGNSEASLSEGVLEPGNVTAYVTAVRRRLSL